MDITQATELLGGISPQVFMARHWQKKPLLIRQAVRGGVTLVSRKKLFEMAASDEVESRLVVGDSGRWSMRSGPMNRSAMPPVRQPRWTLLVQGVDLHVPAARDLLDRFRFIPDARLDDLMMSYATDGGGVGPHVDSYDVFLLQAQGRRRWRIGKVGRPVLVPDMPLKILANFEPTQEWLLEPGDMLYLPPGWAHDGVAEGECITCSIGFRAPKRGQLGRDVLQRLLDAEAPDEVDPLYRDPGQEATSASAQIPVALQQFSADALARLMADETSLACALGEVLSEPKRGVWFDAAEGELPAEFESIRLDQRSRMLYDDRHLFINGESFRAGGRDAKLMRRFADRRELPAADARALSAEALGLIAEWLSAGWLRIEPSKS